MAPHPGLTMDPIREKARKDLLALLEGVLGKKNLVVEKSLAGPIGLFVKFSMLQEHGLDRVFLLENGNVDSSQKNVCFLVRGEKPTQLQAIAEQIKRLRRDSPIDHEFSVWLVPRRTLICEKIFEEEGVLGDVSISDLPVYFIPLENDVLSLELDSSFRDIYLERDPTSIFLSAKALMLLQQKHGLFPRIVGKGDNARRLADLLLRMRKELASEEASGLMKSSALGLMPSSTIDSLIVIDREVDFATPLLTQLTYEGLVDELFGVEYNQVEVDSTIIGQIPQAQGQGSSSRSVGSSSQRGLKRKVQLDSTDKLFEQLRDSNFAIVGDMLSKIARRLESDYESRHKAKSTAELRTFVDKLPGYQAEQQSLKIHINLAEEMTKHTRSEIFRRILEVQQNLAMGSDPSLQHETIEELIARNVPLHIVLRLLCLESCMGGGLRQKDFENFRRQIIHGYGFQHLLTLDSLEKMRLFEARSSAGGGLVPVTQQRTNYSSLRKSLRLVVDEVNEHEPDDISYVYSGFAPLSIRLVQCVIQKSHLLSLTKGPNAVMNGMAAVHGWAGFQDIEKQTIGQTFNIVQKPSDEKALKARTTLTGMGGRKTVVVFFLGGITFTEIAALRFITKQEEEKREIVICTTGIISGNRMMDAATEKRDFGKM
ncbi:MAG: hypothetical protein M1834_001624 [Cirrosporium novae-zelandiae]|nr:MAG: hypothetical protein M1834_004141 [Cirrosporium novae-zelandiae]KAI9735608.1 MAG: hypothetical protein M1834_001624 [Cirrosporium novae-zelandiae]